MGRHVASMGTVQGLAHSWAPQKAEKEKIVMQKSKQRRHYLECLHGDHPGGNRGAQVLGSKRSQRNIFPLLDVPRGPVVHENHSKDVLVRVLGSDGLAHGRALATDEEGHLELEVHQAARTKLGWLSVNWPAPLYSIFKT